MGSEGPGVIMQPIVIQDTVSIAANSSNNNVIASNTSLVALRRLPFPAKVTLAMVGSASLVISFDIGGENIVDASNLRVSASTPQIPLDVVTDNGYGQEGDLLTLKAVNPTAGALTLRYMIIAEPLAEPGTVVPLPPNNRVIVQGPIAIANNTIDFQLLNGLRYERPAKDSIVDFFMTQSAAGLLRQVYVDSDRIAPPSTISLENRIPQDPFDLTVGGIEVAKDSEIQLSVTNQSGGALNVFFKMVLRELYR